MMDNRIELPLEVAYNYLYESLSNLGFIVCEINGREGKKNPTQIIFSVTTHPQSSNLEYFSLQLDEGNSTMLRELDLTGNEWQPTVKAKWLSLHSARPTMERALVQAA